MLMMSAFTILSVSVYAVCFIVFFACNSDGSKKEHENQDMNNMSSNTTQNATDTDDKMVKTVAITYTNLDTKAAASIKEIVDHYLHIKNALAYDNAPEASNGGEAMASAISKVDKSLFTSEQKIVYENVSAGLKEHAIQIGKKGDNIQEQREHFVALSEDVYGLVKAFGAGGPMYNDYCPMARDNKGAMWISEMKEIKNPYFGAKMLSCGSVKEIIRK